MVTPTAAPEEAAALGPSEKPIRTHRRRGWVLPVATGAVGVIASGTLAGFLLSTIGQRDNAQHQLAAAQATLTTTGGHLTAARADAATRW